MSRDMLGLLRLASLGHAIRVVIARGDEGRVEI